MPAAFYILYSKSIDRYYIGHTTEPIEERIRKHNTRHNGFTGKTNDWQLMHVEYYETKGEAYARERTVKRWRSVSRIERLIAG